MKIFFCFAALIFFIGCKQSSDCGPSNNDELKSLLKVTWFIEQQRSEEYLGLIFDNREMVFLKNKKHGNEIIGSYCLDENFIYFKNKSGQQEMEIIRIKSITKHELILEFENGERRIYYNPEANQEK